jgi:integrase
MTAHEPSTPLDPISPEDSVDWYLDHRRRELRVATRRKHRSALGTFVDWTNSQDIDNLNEISGRQLLAFKTWLKRESDLATVSLNGNLAILQRFLRFCETIEAVHEGLADRTPLPNVPAAEEVSYEVPTADEVESIRSHFRRFEYASRRHVEFELIAEIGIRLGAVRAIDLDDFDREQLVIHLRHRPEAVNEYGTPLKNGSDGERIVNISDQLCEFVVDYIEHNRVAVTDDFGREPLFTTNMGRPSTATVRRDFYKMTRPCEYTGDCPHDRQISECEAAKNANAADCPSRYSTHPLRKWAIMRQLDSGIPKELLSDRVDVSVPVLDKHYDQRSMARKSRQRREVLEDKLVRYVSNKE